MSYRMRLNKTARTKFTVVILLTTIYRQQLLVNIFCRKRRTPSPAIPPHYCIVLGVIPMDRHPSLTPSLKLELPLSSWTSLHPRRALRSRHSVRSDTPPQRGLRTLCLSLERLCLHDLALVPLHGTICGLTRGPTLWLRTKDVLP